MTQSLTKKITVLILFDKKWDTDGTYDLSQEGILDYGNVKGRWMSKSVLVMSGSADRVREYVEFFQRRVTQVIEFEG